MPTSRKSNRPKKVAIACQGGGSHAAFTAGVLGALLTRDDYAKEFYVSALTGTSGGALCAGLAWSRMVRPPRTDLLSASKALREAEKDRGRNAAKALKEFWQDLACDGIGDVPTGKRSFDQWLNRYPFDYADIAGNAMLVGLMRMMPTLETSCNIVSGVTYQRMLELFRRHLPLGLLDGKVRKDPYLRIGATDVLHGRSIPLAAEEFNDEEIHMALLASAAIPPLFQPVPLKGTQYWDGLFSHNPPVDCLTNLKKKVGGKEISDAPEEIWVIQINPSECDVPPSGKAEIVDRRNELSGNIALAAELYHIDAMNWLLTNKKVPAYIRKGLRHLYQPITMRVVTLPMHLDYASKYDRSRKHIDDLIECGHLAAGSFFDDASIWTCEDEGVHTARLQTNPMRAGAPSLDLEPAGATFCDNTTCPCASICNTWPAVQDAAKGAFDFAQKNLEYMPGK